MHVSPLKSIAAKIFYATSVMLVLVIGVITWRNEETFRSFLMNQIKTEILSQAKESAEGIRNKIQSYASLLALVMHSNAGRSMKDQQNGYDAFVNFNKDFVLFESFIEVPSGKASSIWKSEIYSKTGDVKSPNFGLQSPELTMALLRKQSEEFVNAKFNHKFAVNLSSFSRLVKIPTITMFVLFSTNDGKRKIAALTLWQHAISSHLPDSSDVTGYLISTNSNLLSSSKTKDIFAGRAFLPPKYLKTAFSGQSRQGLLELRDDRELFEKVRDLYGKPKPIMAGSYYHLANLDSAVIIERNVAALYDTVVRIVVKSLLHAWLFLLLAMGLSYLTAEGIARRIRSTIEATKRIAVGDFSVRIKADSNDEIAVLAESVNTMTMRIQNLLVDSLEKMKLQDELHTAEIVQQRFLPAERLDIRSLNVFHYYHSANFCSGDWWGHFSLGDGLELICIADVVGHGVASALVTAMTHSYFATVAHRCRVTKEHPSPAGILTEFNEVLNGSMHGFMTATCFVAIFDMIEGKMVYSNAGHNFPYFFSKNTDVNVAEGSTPIKPKSLTVPGTPVGIVPDAVYKESSIVIGPGDRLVMYTDGLMECKSPEKVQWGKSSLTKSLTRHSVESAQSMLKAVVGDANNHFADHPLDDDVTVVVIEVSSSWFAPKKTA